MFHLLSVSQSFPPSIGGVSTYLRVLLPELVNRGISIDALHLLPQNQPTHVALRGVAEHFISDRVRHAEWGAYAAFKEALYRLNHDLEDTWNLSFEGAVARGYRDVLNKAADKANDLILSKETHIIHVQDYQFIGLAKKLNRPVKAILSWHSPFPIRHKPYSKYLAAEMDHYDIVVFSTSKYRNLAVENGLTSTKCLVLPPVTDSDLFFPNSQLRAQARKRLGIKDDSIVVSCVQRCDSKSGHDQLLSAFERCAPKIENLVLLLVGGGSLTDALSNIRASYRRRIERVVFNSQWSHRIRLEGTVAYSELPDIYRSTDVLAALSKRECFGLFVTEGMLSGVAILGNNVDGICEQISHLKTGILIEPENIEATVEAMDQLARRVELRSQLGSAARKDALLRFEKSALVEKHVEMYKNLLQLG